MRSGATPAFVLARVCAPAAQAWLPVSAKRQRKPGVCGPLWWLLRPASDGGPGTPAIVDVIRFSDAGQARNHSAAGPAVF